MALKKHLIPIKANSKREGYAVLVFLFSSMIFLIPALAITYRQFMKFSDLTGVLIQQKQEKIAILKSTNESIEYLSSDKYPLLSFAVSVNPSSSSELLIYENSGIMGEHKLSSVIYYMNYVISDDSIISDASHYPPSQKTSAGERHFLIKTTLNKDGIPSHCEETAVEITPSGNINEIWHREFVIY